MRTVALKVGDLAKRTGLTVRTLHYYEELRLLTPSQRSEAGHRLYNTADIARLQQIKSLRQLGFSLDEIKALLESPDFSPYHTIQLHLARLREQIELQQQLCRRLEALADHLCAEEEVSVEDFIKTIEVISMVEWNFTPEQMEEIQERGRQLGEEHIREVEAEWPQLIAKMKVEMDNGADPASPTVLALTKRWIELVNEFTGGNPEIHKALNDRYHNDSALQQQTGIDPQLLQYVGKSMAAYHKQS
jgi:MerR family transcriptional regulator, thiopeptide resistance regulator